MLCRLQLRDLSEKERETIQEIARSRTAAVRAVERARIIQASHESQSVAAIASGLQAKEAKVRKWIHRFNERGLEGLADEARAGRPATYSAEQVSEVVAASLSDPQSLGLPLPLGHWIDWKRTSTKSKASASNAVVSTICCCAKGCAGARFGERVDPDFAAKRG